MSTNKFIEKLDKEWFNDIKNNFKNKDDIDRENNQTNLLKEISKTKTNIDRKVSISLFKKIFV